MRKTWFGKAALIGALFASTSALAQATQTEDAPVYLIADQVFLDGEDLLVASGHVEARQGERRLIAEKITYDQTSDTLTIEGSIRLEDGSNTVVLADSAELSDDMREGILRGARLILEYQLQMAAVEMQRTGARYQQLSKVAVTSCHVCDDGKPPLWQIRARRVIHDQETRNIYFEGAQLRVLDVPVFYLPKMRLPDPTVKRARGFLIPEIVSSSTLGTGIRTPYFLPIGDHADLTVSPLLSAETKTVELRYRQAFYNGDIEINAAGSQDTLRQDVGRSYVFADGKFQLPEKFRLQFDIETTSDSTYLQDYDYSSKDRLDSALLLTRDTRTSSFGLGGTFFETLRSSEENDTQASRVGEARYELRMTPQAIGGEARLGFLMHEHVRDSRTDIVGRDVQRVASSFDWRRSWIVGNGFDFQLLGGATTGYFDLDDDSTLRERTDYTIPYASATLRWPLEAVGAQGGTHLLEPVIQLAWSKDDTTDIPNDESTDVEFDSGNLFSLSRFPAPDQTEDGLRANIGLGWTRWGADGSYSHLSLGRVIRAEKDNRFSGSSGLAGLESDWLFETQIGQVEGPMLTARSLLDDHLRLAKVEAQLGWEFNRGTLDATYLWLDKDTQEDRDSEVSEWTLGANYQFAEFWTGAVEWRYDLVDDYTSKAGLGLRYENECVKVDLSASRRFTSSDNLDPSTTVGLTVSLSGFSAGRSSGAVRQTCKT
ncbi:LPS-assembly protein LptD [Donghicola sp. C2-DW-16]|uniref:LPS-assembly protein LptD n=1 Tax=Donghicola mangrovi TaxID=2729614 RepID=A0ABX2PDG9_9RHOB|nr:LPS assembly protein LptD [Donghicola mangrovi]NVO26882.1 LPS-assembly protein LptD [Donghicola mangrovi]